jgi:plasmid maintenance system killer protein
MMWRAVVRNSWRGNEAAAQERATLVAPQPRRATRRQLIAYVANSMIRSFKSKPLAELWEKGRTSKIDAKMRERVLRRLDRLDAAATPQEMNIPGFDFHALRASNPRAIRSM